MKKLIITVFLQLACLSLMAAENKEMEIVTLHFNHGDSVSLRWIPTNEEGFVRSAKEGYVVQRRKKGESNWQSISSVLRPLSNAQMEVIEATDMNIYPLREMIYKEGRKEYAAETGSESNSLDNALLYAMTAYGCDISLPVAKAGALHFTDKAVDRTATYEYRVVFGSDEHNAQANVYVAQVNMSQKSVLPRIDDFTADFDENYVHFQWGLVPLESYYTAYFVEKSTDGVHFAPIKERPFIPAYTDEKMKDIAIYRDTFPNDDVTYYYRVAGYSPFGFNGPYSKVLQGKPKFNFKQIKVKIDTIVRKAKFTEIRWNIDKAYQSRIKGVQVLHSRDLKNISVLNTALLPASTKSYKDMKNLTSGYYAVVAYGHVQGQVTDTNFVYSHVADNIPPAAPAGLKAVVDSTGLTTVTWNKNSEPDIFAYRIYGSNSGKDDDYFTIRGSYIKDTFIVDTLTLNTLTKYKYYKATAVDRSYNESDFSAPVRAVRPDTIAPVGAVFRLLRQEKEAIIVEWANSPSDDAVEMELYRQIDDTGKVELLNKYDLTKKTPTSYKDTREFSGERVQYFMTVRDDAGNEARTFSNRLKTEGESHCIQSLKAIVVNEKKHKSITLHWECKSKEIKRYAIYRKRDDGRMIPIASVAGNALSYEDKDVSIGSKYTYIVRPISTENICPAEYTDPIEFAGLVK